MRTTFYILVFLVELGLVACDGNAHRGESEHTLSVDLVMNISDPVYDVYLWAFDENGILRYEFTFANPQELAAATLPLPEGEYTLVVCNHLADAFIRETEIGTTRLTDLHIVQANADESPEHAHYGITQVSIPYGLEGWQWIEAQVNLSRILAELQVTISNLPSEVSSVTGVVENCATGFFPAENRLDDGSTPVLLGDAVKDEATGKAVFRRMRLMPTVNTPSSLSAERGGEVVRTRMQLTLHYTHGGPDLTIKAEMPPLQNGGVYEVDIPYGEIHPGIPLYITEINGWKDATPIYGEILTPE